MSDSKKESVPDMASAEKFCLDLETSWKRVKEDLNGYSFITDPFEQRVIESSKEQWLTSLLRQIEDGTYHPERCRIVNAPKPKWHIRPGGVLTLEDHTYYTALVLAAIEHIQSAIKWSENTVRFSNLINTKKNDKYWFRFEMAGWNNFRLKSIELIEKGLNHVVIVDISGFFENIEIRRLIQDLRACGASPDVISGLSLVLNRWGEPRERGIPQGFRPSGILAELYLNSIDSRLVNEEIQHLRYVDDIRIFCKSEVAAKTALHQITVLLREKGLNLQSSKSKIVTGEEAIRMFSDIANIINEINARVKTQDDTEASAADPPYPTQFKPVANILVTEENNEVLHTAFQAHFLQQQTEFDKSLFHYLIRRLGRLKNDCAVDYCISELKQRPEETKFILDYLLCFRENLRMVEKVLSVCNRQFILKPYQLYLAIKWLFDNKLNSPKILKLVRRILRIPQMPWYIHAYAIAHLGDHGDASDVEFIETLYGETTSDILRGLIMIAIRRMEPTRRDSIYGRAEKDSDYIKNAIRYAKALPA